MDFSQYPKDDQWIDILKHPLSAKELATLRVQPTTILKLISKESNVEEELPLRRTNKIYDADLHFDYPDFIDEQAATVLMGTDKNDQDMRIVTNFRHNQYADIATVIQPLSFPISKWALGTRALLRLKCATLNMDLDSKQATTAFLPTLLGRLETTDRLKIMKMKNLNLDKALQMLCDWDDKKIPLPQFIKVAGDIVDKPSELYEQLLQDSSEIISIGDNIAARKAICWDILKGKLPYEVAAATRGLLTNRKYPSQNAWREIDQEYMEWKDKCGKMISNLNYDSDSTDDERSKNNRR